MAAKVEKADLDRKATSTPGTASAEGDFMGGINKFLGNFNTTIDKAGKLLGQYKNIKEKLTGENKQSPNRNLNPPPPPPPPQPPKEQIKEAEFTEIDKKERAIEIFNELHEFVKPQIPKLKFITGAMILQWVLKPENKKTILAEIEKKL